GHGISDETIAPGVPGDANAFVGQGVPDDLPAVPYLAEHLGPIGPDVVEEHLVQVVRARDTVEASDRGALAAHRDEEDRDSRLVPRGRPLDPSQEIAPIGPERPGSPDLLAADPVAIPVRDSTGLQVGEVGAGIGFAKTLAPDGLAGGDEGQMERL